jgi:hypothetical protein
MMAYHKTNLGSYGESLQADMNGYVPEAKDGPWDFAVDHGTERTHNNDGTLTDYGQWWENEGFREWRDATVKASEKAQAALAEWQEAN